MTKLKPPPDKPDKPSPIPPVNDGLKLPKMKPFDPILPHDAPVKKDK